MERIKESDYEILETLYKAGIVEVLKAKIIKTQKPIAIKKLYVSSCDELDQIYKEAIAMTKLRHPNIVNLRSCIIGGEGADPEYVLFIMDYYHCGDLGREIHKRKRDQDFWTETKLLEHMKSLINAYKFMQENSIAHRDIKPNNIFVTDNNTLKVADLGSVSNRNAQIKSLSINLTIAGTPSYLSPLLKTAYNGLRNKSGTGTAKHDPFKSDVYSLGLTFLYMASLQKVVRVETVENNVEKNIWTMINQLKYSQNFKWILYYMLLYDEVNRPNFIQLDEIFSNLFNPNPIIPQEINRNFEEEKQNFKIKVNEFNISNIISNKKISYKVYTKNKAEDLLSLLIKNIIDLESFAQAAEVINLLNSLHFKIKIGKLSNNCIICKENNCDYITICCSIPIHQKCYIKACNSINNQNFRCRFCRVFHLSSSESIQSLEYTPNLSVDPIAPIYYTEKTREASIIENDNQQDQNNLIIPVKRQEVSQKLQILTSLCFICRKGNITIVSFPCGHKFCKECFSVKFNKCRKEICFSCPTEYDYDELLAILCRLNWDANHP